MSEETPKPPEDESPEDAGPTRRLEKAVDDIATGSIEGTLVDIVAHTGEHPAPEPEPDPSVSEALQAAKRPGNPTPGMAPAATMYEPTRPGQVKSGSSQATQFGPTGAQEQQGAQTPGATPSQTPGSMQGRPVAPFGGKIMVGTRIGQIEITGVLGKGGMGEVFKGYHHALDINCAIKVLPDELSRNELVRQRFLREARLCVKLDHPHVVRVYNVDEYAGNLYLVMEMIEGTDAAHMLKNGGRFRYRRALEIGTGCAEALAYASAQGLVHRDVKPHNILLGRDDGKIKLSDFGLARAAAGSSHLTMSGQIMGTPHYMSPEQAEAKEVTDKSDVYSLGVTLYHMLTGETPFVGDTPISVAVQHIAKEILYPEARFAAFPKELVAVLKRMTAKDPAKRCSAKQAAVWLKKLITMSTDDDIHLAADPGRTLAPVVRESAAFEAAAKERENRDERAREMARTLLATMREARQPSGQVAALPPTPATATTAPPMQKSGKGGLIAVGLLLLLLGGTAGWYFGLGGKDFVAKQGWLAGDSGQNTGDTGGTTTNGGGTGGTTTNGGGTGGTTTPDEDHPMIKTRLEALSLALANATTLEDLLDAKEKLMLVESEVERLGSTRQKEEFRQLRITFDRSYTVLTSQSLFGKIAAAVRTYGEKKAKDIPGAIAALNDALAAGEALSKLTFAEDMPSMIKDDREFHVTLLRDSYNEFVAARKKVIEALVADELYDDAVKELLVLESLHMPTEDLNAVQQQRLEIHCKDRHIRARVEIRDRAFENAIKTIEDLEKYGVPESMKKEHEAVVAALAAGINAAFDEYMANAAKAAAKHDFVDAKSAFDRAFSLPRRSTDQTLRLSTARYSVNVQEALHLAGTTLAAGDFNGARAHLANAEKLLQGAGEIKVEKGLQDAYAALQTKFTADLESRFSELLAAADAAIKAKDFAGAGKNLAAADKLPLDDAQQKRLDAFVAESESALSDYVRGLIAEIERALQDGDFEAAQAALDQTSSLAVPPDMQEKLKTLSENVAKEAVRRHSELLEVAKKATQDKRYKAAQEALAKAKAIPAGTDAEKRREDLAKVWNDVLTADVNSRLKSAMDLLNADDFEGSRKELDDAAAIALTEELGIIVGNKRKTWEERLEAKFSELLTSAIDYCGRNLFKTADALLEEAAKLTYKDQARLLRLSQATDARDTARDAYIEKLFKDLEKAVSNGNESEGNAIIEKLESMSQYLGPGRQKRLSNARTSLTGESPEARFARLPAHLKKWANNDYTKVEQSFGVNEPVSAIFATADGKWAAAGTNSGKVYFYNLKRGSSLGTSKGGNRPITAVAVSPDGSNAVTGNDDGELVVYDLSKGSPSALVLGAVNKAVNSLAYSTDGKVLFALSRDGFVTRFNPVTRAQISNFKSGVDSPQTLAVSPDGRWLAVGGEDAMVALFDASKLTLRKTLQGPGSDTVQRVMFSADSAYLISGSIDDGVGLWEIAKLSEKSTVQYKGLAEWIRGVGFSGDGRVAVAFDNEAGIKVWDRQNGTEKRFVKFDQFKDTKEDFDVSTGFIGPDGTGLVATRQGRIIHFTFGSGR